MTNAPSGEFQTVSVRRCWTAATPTGATALVLDTAEMGPIAFVLNQEVIGILRQKLADAETFLRRTHGQA